MKRTHRQRLPWPFCIVVLGINAVSSNPNKIQSNYPDHPYQVPEVDRDRDGLVGEISSCVGHKACGE